MKTNSILALLICLGILPGCGPVVKEKAAIAKTSTKDNYVTAYLNTSLSENKNTIYCSTFQLAWNELQDNIIKSPLKLSGDPQMADELNKKEFTKDGLDSNSYVAMAGFNKDKIVDKINSALKKKFGSEAPSVTANLKDPNDILSYAFLYKDLKFNQEFMDLKNSLKFDDNGIFENLNCFGIKGVKQDDKDYKTAMKQVTVIDYKSPDDFIISLDAGNDNIIMYKGTSSETLAATLNSVSNRIKNGKKEDFLPGDTLMIPNISFDIHRDYNEIINKALLNPGFNDYYIGGAEQNIKLNLTKSGAKIKSDAKITILKGAILHNQPKSLLFDKSFLIYFKQKNSDKPYLVIWVSDPAKLGN